MSETRDWKRIRGRLGLNLPVRVQGRESVGNEWTEITRLVDVTTFGAGLTLKRPIERGRLLYLTIPMPRQLRVFDHVEDQYRVWALVRHVQVSPTPDNSPLFEIGVAFTGKRPPRSYEENPAKRYEIASQATQQLSEIEDLPAETATDDSRIRTRHNIPVDILIETFNGKSAVEFTEQTVTENISQQGAAIYTTLTIPVGRFIRLTSEQFKLSVYAAVRAHSMGPTGVPRIHVEFIDREWPL